MIQVFTKEDCTQCEATKMVLEEVGIPFTVTDMGRDRDALEQIKNMGFLQAPVILVTNAHNELTDSWSGFRPEKLAKLHV